MVSPCRLQKALEGSGIDFVTWLISLNSPVRVTGSGDAADGPFSAAQMVPQSDTERYLGQTGSPSGLSPGTRSFKVGGAVLSLPKQVWGFFCTP